MFDDARRTGKINMWDVPYLEVEDVANGVLFLACAESVTSPARRCRSTWA
jgi:hypothetical protein